MATLATPERRAPSEERHPVSLLAGSRSVQNMSPSSSRQQAATQLTMEAALAVANNNPTAALENVLAERNMLSSQNTQLWKLIEKQRAVHGNAIKELERVRADRDRAISKLDPERASRKPHAHRSSSSSATNLSSSTPPPVTSSASERPNGHRFPMMRHQSDDVSLSSPRTSTPTIPPLSTSRSHEPIRPSNQNHTPSTSVVEASTSSSMTGAVSRSEPSTLISSPLRADSLPLPSLSNVSVSSSASTQPLHVHKVQPHPTTTVQPPTPSATAAVTPLSAKRQSSLQYPVAQMPLPPPSSIPSAVEQNRSLGRESRITLPDEARRYIANMQDSPLPSPSPPQTVFSNSKLNGKIVEEPAVLPEEEYHPHPPDSNGLGIYDANRVSTRRSRSASVSSGQGSSQGLEPPNVDVVEDKSSAFLDLGDDDDDDPSSADARSADARSEVPDTAVSVPPISPTDPAFTMRSSTSANQPQNLTMSSTDISVPIAPSSVTQSRPQPTVTTHVPSAPYDPFASPAHDVDTRSINTSASPISPENSRSTPPPASMQRIASPMATKPQVPPISTQAQVQAQRAAYAHAQQQEAMAQMQGQTHPSYPNLGPIYGNPNGRARLLEQDLQRCRVRVVGSNIRANDRGKEVLSFVVQVSPSGSPDAADSWKIEKLYSDVLGLDSRVRSKLSRSNLKKLGSLPDNKLFKDHAPAKVDQRKAILENYLMTVVRAPLKDFRDLCEFFSTDVINEASAPVTQSGYKEGYLTKRGKNFGGWKTRYFVLQGPVLEYYESRGGAHLGSIGITGAQIGRQQKAASSGPSEDDNEYRHAFLIIESKKGAGVQHTRHVLCAESDQERDNWVDVLVRYVMGSYDDSSFTPTSTSTTAYSASITSVTSSVTMNQTQPRPSISSQISVDATPTKRMTKADIAKGNAVPISQLAQDQSNAKLFQTPPILESSSNTTSPSERYPPSLLQDRNLQALSNDVPLSSSLPTHLDVGGHGGLLSQRSASELGHYADMRDSRSPTAHLEPQRSGNQRQDRVNARSSVHPSLSTVQSSPTFATSNNPTPPVERVPSPDPSASMSLDVSSKVKISGPLNGTPIPAGYKFGAKDAPPPDTYPSADRSTKAKSRNFWGFGRGGGEKSASAGGPGQGAPRAVFGVSISEALNVAQIANLPAVVFRCIQYLEAKKADQEEGIYRLSGSSAVIKNLKDRFNAEGDVDLLASDEFWDPHAIAGLLKSFLRELPTSILTRDLHLKFLAVIDLADSGERVTELAQLISQLPLPNYSLLRALTAHLILIVQNSSANKMTMRNVGIVFSPTLGIPAGVFSLMLGEFNRVFNVDGDAADVDASTTDAERDVAQPRRVSVQNNRNSRNYADGDADRMLGLVGRSLKPPDVDEDSADDMTLPDSASGTETEDADVTATLDKAPGDGAARSPARSPARERANSTSQAETPARAHKAATVAATRGLHVMTDRRRSGAPGLPHSPRPGLPHSPRPAGKTNTPPAVPPMAIVSAPPTPR